MIEPHEVRTMLRRSLPLMPPELLDEFVKEYTAAQDRLRRQESLRAARRECKRDGHIFDQGPGIALAGWYDHDHHCGHCDAILTVIYKEAQNG